MNISIHIGKLFYQYRRAFKVDENCLNYNFMKVLAASLPPFQVNCGQNIFEMAAMPFPCKGNLLIQGNLLI